MSKHAHTVPEDSMHVGHIVPLPLLFGVLVALLVLTFLTVAATWVNFGHAINLWIALGIATVKAALVVLYFMHLKYDRPIAAVILISSLFFVVLFIAAAMTDSLSYSDNVAQFRAADPNNYAPLMNQP